MVYTMPINTMYKIYIISKKQIVHNIKKKTGKTEKNWKNCFLRRSWGVYLVCEKAVFPVFPVFSVFPSVFQKFVPKQNWKNWKNCFLRRSWGVYLVCEKAVFPVFPVFFQFFRASSKRLFRNKSGKTEKTGKTAFSGEVGVST